MDPAVGNSSADHLVNRVPSCRLSLLPMLQPALFERQRLQELLFDFGIVLAQPRQPAVLHGEALSRLPPRASRRRAARYRTTWVLVEYPDRRSAL